MQVLLLLAVSATHASRNGKVRGVSWPRVGLLLGFGVCAGVNVGSWVAVAMETAGACPRVAPPTSTVGRLARAAGLYDALPVDTARCAAESTALCLQAFALTAGLYVTFAVAGMLAARRDVRNFASLLLPLGWVVFSAQVCAALGIASGDFADLLYVRLGLLVYAGFVLVDTAKVAEQVRDTGDADVVGHAVSITAGALHLFIRLVTILAEIKAEQKKEAERKRQ